MRVISCLAQSPLESLEGEHTREWLWSLKSSRQILPSMKCFQGIRSCCSATFVISGERCGKSLSFDVPRRRIYRGIQYASSGCAKLLYSHFFKSSVISVCKVVLPSEEHLLRCAEVSASPQLGHLPSRAGFHLATIDCVPQKPELCLASHCWYICGLLRSVASRASQSTASKDALLQPSPLLLWRLPCASRGPRGVVYRALALCNPSVNLTSLATSVVCFIPRTNTAALSQGSTCFLDYGSRQCRLCWTAAFAVESQWQFNCCSIVSWCQNLYRSW